MSKNIFKAALDAIEFRHLYYFAVVAEEGSMRRAAERLFIAQPPLSRQIKQLEERLGVELFVRNSKGLTLTKEGTTTLHIIQPLLREKEKTFARLQNELTPQGKTLRIGFTTAFEQGIFADIEDKLNKKYKHRLKIRRADSPKLANDVRRGRLDVALVTIPLDTPGVMLLETTYMEPLILAIPEKWPEAKIAMEKNNVSLNIFTGKNLFWFKRERHPAFFDYTKALFAQAHFAPHCIEEPLEHDVLLARIASGEGLGLFAASFASIQRTGVIFANIAPSNQIFLRLGIVSTSGASTEEDILTIFASNFK